jgi:two-component system chemotaxis response regulator CheB
MGCDGTKGLEALKRAGGCSIAQDEASSVVWGMPGSAVSAGCIDQVLPLSEIAAAVQALTASPHAAAPPAQHGGA